jgi:RNA polymerase sigma factor (sigma-70 family)
MTIFSPDPVARDTRQIMTPAEAAAVVRGWFEEHVSTIERALAWYGVHSVQERADLTQDVLLTGYLALLRGERIETPRAWLRDCARKHASNHRRKATRRALSTGYQVVNTVPTPEQIVEHRELLRRLFELLDDDAQGILFDARVDEMSWDEIARERGISVDQARHQLRRAIAQMEAALEDDDSARKDRQSLALPVAMSSVIEAVRADADSVTPDARRRIWESLEQRMRAATGGAGEPGESAKSQRPAPDSTQIIRVPGRSTSTRVIAGLVGGGVVVGIILGYLVHGVLATRLSSAPIRAGAAPDMTKGDLASRPDSLDVLARRSAATEVPAISEEPSTSPPLIAQSIPTTPPAKGASTVGSTMLLERARAFFAAGDVRAALSLLDRPAGRDTESHRKLLHRICATPEARNARACAESGSVPRRPDLPSGRDDRR